MVYKRPSTHHLPSFKQRHHHHHHLPTTLQATNQADTSITKARKAQTATMHLTTSALALLITTLTASTTAVSTQEVFNWCADPVFLVNVNSTGSTTGPEKIAGGGSNWATPIVGVGNSLGISKNDQYWSNGTAKLIWGTSTDAGILYWTVSNVDGDPFAGSKFEVTSWEGDVCGNTTT